MKRLVCALCLLTLPTFAAEKSSVAMSPTTPVVDLKRSYRYADAPTPNALKKWCTCGHPEGGAEALVWRLARTGFGYARQTFNATSTLLLNKPEYDWGVRVFGGYQLPSCWGVRASYLYFSSEFTDDGFGGVVAPFLLPVYAPPALIALAEASQKTRNRLQVVDAELVTDLYCSCLFSFKAFGGARWIDHNSKELIRYLTLTNTTTLINQKTSFDGAGIRFGLYSALYPIPCGLFRGFSLHGSLATSALIGRRFFTFEASEFYFLPGDTTLVHPKATAIIPAFDVRLGVSYCIEWACLAWEGYVTYELQWYQNAQERLDWTIGFAVPNNPTVRELAYAGFSFGLRVKY